MDTKNMPKIQTKLEVKNEADSKTAELYLYGVIRQAYPWEEENDVISANRVKNEIDNLGGKDVNIHLNSPGGDVFESITICNLLKQHNGDVDIYIDGLAASGASIIATAGENVYMFKNSMQMIHKASTFAWGNADDFRKQATDLDKIDSAVKSSYMEKFVGTEQELTDLIADETFLTADECLAFGLCTEILDRKPDEKPPVKNNIKQNLFNKYRKAPVNGATKPTAELKPLFNNFKKGDVQ